MFDFYHVFNPFGSLNVSLHIMLPRLEEKVKEFLYSVWNFLDTDNH